MKLLPIALSLTFTLNAASLAAQESNPLTLHVYANRIQIPVLASEPFRPPISQLQFDVRLDSGPPFRASHVRLEGDDPIALSILLDVTEDQDNLLPDFSDAFANFASESLKPQDRVSIYVLDCRLIHAASNIPADPDRIRKAVDGAIQSARLREPSKPHHGCERSIHLWDALLFATGQLSNQSGRRVVLAVSHGNDGGSTHKWLDLRNLANDTGTAIFGMTLLSKPPDQFTFIHEDMFLAVCQLSGGFIRVAEQKRLPTQLEGFIRNVRDRYIVEFPRPNDLTGGAHSILVKISDSKSSEPFPGLVLPAGISLPIADPAILADPNTIPSDPSNAPTLGKRRILPPR
jgi:hypothetical protein